MRQATDPDRTVREAGTAPVARASGVSRFAFDVPHNLSLGEPEPQRDQRGPELAAQVQRIALTIVVDESSERRFNGLAGGVVITIAVVHPSAIGSCVGAAERLDVGVVLLEGLLGLWLGGSRCRRLIQSFRLTDEGIDLHRTVLVDPVGLDGAYLQRNLQRVHAGWRNVRAAGGAGVTGTAGATAGATAAAARGDETHPGGDHDRGRHCRNTGLAFAAAWGGRLARIGRSGRLGQLQRYVLPAFPDSHSMFPAIL